MPRELDLLEAIARQTDVPPGQVLRILDCSFRELHRRIYEYDDGNGDYVCERLFLNSRSRRGYTSTCSSFSAGSATVAIIPKT